MNKDFGGRSDRVSHPLALVVFKHLWVDFGSLFPSVYESQHGLSHYCLDKIKRDNVEGRKVADL